MTNFLQRKKVLIFFAFISVYVIWGSGYLLNKIAVQELDPLMLASVRFMTSGVIIFLISILLKFSLKISKKQLINSVQSIGNKNGLIVNNSRHLHALNEALVSIKNVKKGILNNLPGDLLSIDLKEAIEYVGTITGKIDTDNDILDRIFSQFCIGK